MLFIVSGSLKWVKPRGQQVAHPTTYGKARNDEFPARKVLSGCLKEISKRYLKTIRFA
ncbi:MAG: hypothetical protein J5680_03150 [Neisseriaceae bacterium]|nr:hypothetical protein [Neisseriaceae bacterium]MBR5674994.1 hypothetical protein [Neisseriaceae bacterium]